MPLRPPAGFISAFFDPLRNPDAPTIGTASAGGTTADVSFTAPANVGGSAISSYSAISTPEGIIGSAASSPVTVSGHAPIGTMRGRGRCAFWIESISQKKKYRRSHAAGSGHLPTPRSMEKVLKLWFNGRPVPHSWNNTLTRL